MQADLGRRKKVLLWQMGSSRSLLIHPRRLNGVPEGPIWTVLGLHLRILRTMQASRLAGSCQASASTLFLIESSVR